MARTSISALLGAAFAAFFARIHPKNERLERLSAIPPMYALVMTGLANIIVICVPSACQLRPVSRRLVNGCSHKSF